MEILKEHTRGLCSECYSTVDADVICENGQIIIRKKCPEHGTTTGVLERDADFFKKIVHPHRNPDPHVFPFRTLMINITHSCNLKCNLCYVPDRDKDLDLSLADIKEAISDYPGITIALSGGEPSLREDLFEIIRFTRAQNKICSLVTNGVKLADYDFVKSLKEAGLSLMNFSFNGMNEKSFTEIENAPLLETKLKALSNIKKVGGIFTQLSFTMAKGINEDQFSDIIKFALDNNDFIYQIRARVATGVGRRLGEKDIYLSDFIKKLAEDTAIPYDLYLRYWVSTFWFPNPYLYDLEYFTFLKEPWVARELGVKDVKDGMYEHLARYVGEKNARRIIDADIRAAAKANRSLFDTEVTIPNFLFVLFSWPDRNTLDYEEAKGLNLDILTRKKEVLPYWDGIIRNEKFGIL